MSRADYAEELFRKGFNCSQSVVMPFASLMGITECAAAKVSVCFGGGTGRMRLTCGCVNAMLIVLGVLYSSSDGSAENKNEMYRKTRLLIDRFKEKNGSINCGELLGGRGIKTDTSFISEARTEGYYKKRPCIGCIRDAVGLLEEFIKENPFQ